MIVPYTLHSPLLMERSSKGLFADEVSNQFGYMINFI